MTQFDSSPKRRMKVKQNQRNVQHNPCTQAVERKDTEKSTGSRLHDLRGPQDNPDLVLKCREKVLCNAVQNTKFFKFLGQFQF